MGILAFLILTVAVNGLLMFHDYPWNGDPFKWAEARDLYVKAMKDRMQFDLEHATIKLKQAIAIYDRDAKFYASLGDCQLRQDKYADAQASFEKSLALNKRNVFAWTRLARALAAQGKMDEAIKAAHQALEAAPGDVVASAELGLLLASTGHQKEAAKVFDETRSLEKESAEYWCLAGRYYHLLNKPQETEAAFRQAASKDPNEPEYAEWLGLALIASDKPDEAQQWLEAACHLNPHSADYWTALANLHMRENRPGLAIEALQHAVKEDPERPYPTAMLGMALLNVQRFPEAEVTLKSALQLDPKNETLRGAYVTSLLMQAKLAEIQRTVLDSLKDPQTPNRGAKWVMLGDIAGYEGKPDAARAAYKNALALELSPANKQYVQTRLKTPTTPADFNNLLSRRDASNSGNATNFNTQEGPAPLGAPVPQPTKMQ